MYNSCFNILAGTAYPRGEEFVILGASTIAKSSEKNAIEISRRFRSVIELADI